MNYQTKAIALLFQSALALSSAINAAPADWQTFPAKVVSVHDGDTITVEAKASDGKTYAYKVRLLYIDAPEIAQPGGTAARDYLAPITGQTISVHWQERDRYGRVLGEIADGKTTGSLNQGMVASGNAWYYRAYPPKDTAEKVIYATAEGDAKRAKLGMWSEANPLPPWEWRKAHKAKP